jgi:hypothetical protein
MAFLLGCLTAEETRHYVTLKHQEILWHIPEHSAKWKPKNVIIFWLFGKTVSNAVISMV